MKNTYQSEHAVAQLQSQRRRIWIIHWIRTEPEYQQQGHGTALMEAICKDADEQGISLMLYPSSTNAMSDEQLIKWYHGFGFRGNNPMRRSPEKVRIPDNQQAYNRTAR